MEMCCAVAVGDSGDAAFQAETDQGGSGIIMVFDIRN